MTFRGDEIQIYNPTGTIWQRDLNPETGSYRDRFRTWIVLFHKGVRYMECVIVSGQEREEGTALMKIVKAMERIVGSGPVGMQVVVEGGDLPWPE